MISPSESLLKYDSPVLVKSRGSKARLPDVSGPVPSPSKPWSPTTKPNKEQREEILNTIHPPRVWTQGNTLWVQQVSNKPCTRPGVLNLQEQLGLQLQRQQAMEMGICPIRRELYSQCFDEIIRQVTINCAERGLLLMQVRDEIRMTMHAYQALCESSIAFGMRKAMADLNSDIEKRYCEVEEEKCALEQQVNEWKAERQAIEEQEAQRRQEEQEENTEQIEALENTIQQLKDQLAETVAGTE